MKAISYQSSAIRIKFLSNNITLSERFCLKANNCFGQSLIEAVVAVAVVILIVTGLIVATTSSLKFSSQSSYRTQANQIAQEGMEIVRQLRDSSWVDFVAKSDTTNCLSGSYVWTVRSGDACPSDIGDFYARTVIFEYEDDSGPMKVTMIVDWPEGSSKKSMTLVSYFTNWRTE